MSSITSWTRLEAHTQNPEMTGTLQARIHDPLWMLARQWQLGEFQGEDSGSLVRSDIHHSVAMLDLAVPLECRVEREAVPNTLRRRVEAGLHLLRLLGSTLAERYSSALRERYPLAVANLDRLDEGERRFYDLMQGRSLDGVMVMEDFAGAMAFVEPDPADPQGVERAFDAWKVWYEQLFSLPPDAGHWVNEELEYQADIPTYRADTSLEPLQLEMREYNGGHLDWYAFDLKKATSHPQPPPPLQVPIFSALPAPVSFRGMPLPRYWSFEDAEVNFSRVDSAPEDLARLIFTEFALVYGNDFLLVPMDLPVGSLTHIAKVEVTNTFGEAITIPHMQAADSRVSSNPPWQIFTLSGDSHPPLLFLPPVITGSRLENEAVEVVDFVRDEMANLAWAIEKLVEGNAWQPLHRHELELRVMPEQPSPPGQLTYHLYHPVPSYWFPLVPNGRRLEPAIGTALGKIAAGLVPPGVYDEAIPREGIHVKRSYQYTRWIDGSTHLWSGRKKDVGRGEASSGLAFDTIRLEPASEDG